MRSHPESIEVPTRGTVAMRALMLGLLLAGCGTTAGGGGFVSAVPGTACFVVEGAETCGVADGVPSRLGCKAGVWVQLEACSGSVCTNIGGQLTACGAATGPDASDGSAAGGDAADAGTADDAGASGEDVSSAVDTAPIDTAPIDSSANDTNAGADGDVAAANDGASVVDIAPTLDGDDAGDGATTSDAAGSGSCVGKCGTYSQGASCQCDSSCASYGDCCQDYGSVCGSTTDAGAVDAGPSDTASPDTASPDSSSPDAGGTTFTYCDPPCSSGTYCQQGICINPSCQLPASAASKDINVLTSIALLGEKTGCDLDSDGVPNNVFGKFISIYASFNDNLADAIKTGTFVAAFLPKGWNTSGQPFQIAAASGRKLGGGLWLSAAAYDLKASAATCPILAPMAATAVGTNLVANGGSLTLGLPLAGLPLALKVSDLQLTGTAAGPALWTSLQSGTLCGAITEADLAAAVAAVPDELLAQTGFDKATILMLMKSILKADLDSNNDGIKDAISVAFSIQTAATPIAGFE